MDGMKIDSIQADDLFWIGGVQMD